MRCRPKTKRGLETMYVGGGQGMETGIERLG
jgi:hypothetical protein